MIGLSVRVMPLLRKEVQMSDIRVDGLNLNLQRDDKGHGNWESVGRPAQASAPQQTPSEPAPSEDTPPSQPNENRLVNRSNWISTA